LIENALAGIFSYNPHSNIAAKFANPAEKIRIKNSRLAE
jgi:hypothetical protein